MLEWFESVDANSKSRAARNIAITGAAQAWRVGTGFLLTIVTTRLLTPSDFGILAMVGTATALVALIKDLGISQAIIQRETINPRQINSLFWVSVLVSMALALLLGATAPLIARFYSEPRVELLAVGFALLTLLGGPQAIPTAILNRESQFNRLAMIDIISTTIAFVIGVAGALLWHSYWALYASAASATIASGLGIWLCSRYRPSLPNFGSNTKELLRFGSHVSGFNIANYFARNCDNILIGRFLGGDQLGLYDRAYKLLLFPITQVHGPIGQVLIPLLSRIRTEPDKYRSTYTEGVSLIMVALHPGILVATIFAPQLFELLFGPHWVPAASIFQWLGVAGLHQVMTSTMGWLYLSQGRGSDFFKVGVYTSFLTVASFVAGLPWGAVGVAASYAIVNYVVVVPIVWFATGRQGPVSCADLVGLASSHAIATVASAVVLEGIQYNLPSAGFSTIIALSALSYLVYFCVLLLFKKRRELLWRSLQLVAR
jgi:PST family polysaccharide transporter